MRSRLLACLLFSLLTAHANPIFQITFTGTVTSGSFSGQQAPVDLTGLPVTGLIEIFPSLLPTPIENSSPGFSSFTYADNADNPWLSARIRIGSFAPLDIAPFPSGSTTFFPFIPPAANRAVTATWNDPCCDLLTVDSSFSTSGTDGQDRTVSRDSSISLFFFPGTAFLSRTVPFPAPFLAGPTLAPSTLNFFSQTLDANGGLLDAALFTAQFTVESAEGVFTPEPSTLFLLLAGFAMTSLIRRKTK